MAAGDIVLEDHIDFMGNRIAVGDTVIAVRVPDRTPQMYTGEVLGIKQSPSTWGRTMITKIQVLPTGGYSTTWAHHGAYSGDKAPKPHWIQAENVVKYPPNS